MYKWLSSSLLVVLISPYYATHEDHGNVATSMAVYEDSARDRCPPIAANMTTEKNGRKAWDKCIEYQELVYPCERTESGEAPVRVNRCGHDAVTFLGVKENEFPHLALLGYGDTLVDAQWSCAGTLISDRFVLTSGNCLYLREHGPVKFIRLGVQRTSQKVDPAKMYNIVRIIKHPEYRPPSAYHDIALLETEHTVTLNDHTVPACLHTGDLVQDDRAVETGWFSEIVDKWILRKLADQECLMHHSPSRLLKLGYQAATQMCYGRRLETNPCEVTAGMPLQIFNHGVRCMYTVIGVRSISRACWEASTIYSRVAAFVPWIESQVWP